MTDTRKVHAFIDLANAQNDALERGDCQVWDRDGLLWSVPIELTVVQANDQIMAELDRGRLRPFHDVPTRPHRMAST